MTLPEVLALAKGKINLYLDCKRIDPKLLVEEVHRSRNGATGDRVRQPRRLGEGESVFPARGSRHDQVSPEDHALRRRSSRTSRPPPSRLTPAS